MIIVPLPHYMLFKPFSSYKGFSYFILFGVRYSDNPSLEYACFKIFNNSLRSNQILTKFGTKQQFWLKEFNDMSLLKRR